MALVRTFPPFARGFKALAVRISLRPKTSERTLRGTSFRNASVAQVCLKLWKVSEYELQTFSLSLNYKRREGRNDVGADVGAYVGAWEASPPGNLRRL